MNKWFLGEGVANYFSVILNYPWTTFSLGGKKKVNVELLKSYLKQSELY